MKKTNVTKIANQLHQIGIEYPSVFYNLEPTLLIEKTLKQKMGKITETGALMCDTGKFTGRAPKDRYIVKDELTMDSVWWGDINQPFSILQFDNLYNKMVQHLSGKELYVRDVMAGAEPEYALNVRIINTLPWQNLFCYNMFIRLTELELINFLPEFTVIAAPDFKANPQVDGTKNENFSIINLSKKIILIGGSAYTGEIKKGIFSVLNFLLPHKRNVLSMHCSANTSDKKDPAIFFGLSGTGKTTLSADPNRKLIGDDEHGWTDNGIFNFEGGCYAKVIDLSEEKEPQIWKAIKYGALLENTRTYPGTRKVDFTNTSVTQNTRVSYPIYHIDNAMEPSIAGKPKNIFFLTCDAYGVLPPISKLTKGQAMFHFISGYTAKVAGTEEGVTEPQTVFSACFGAPFMPLHPTVYAEMLGKKMDENKVNVWLVNTGWIGGAYGEGKRISLKYTRAMIQAALEGKLNYVKYENDKLFGLSIPQECPEVPKEVLSPRGLWKDGKRYDEKATQLAKAFHKNFEKFASYANEEILNGAPLVGKSIKETLEV
ncbi:phosphoenolpyruvate carboxykinase (ATP) [Flexithrix dorotheae]|uniref:phosphoenolpyruvate carboxykinase (ATP) n=1 Tax=Flexithrix dorotheae TaxID=70993 RepID=UPI00037FBAD8|nr:phosphoenolpyruvate carboxykinase (ATP) [Flexithrix dorotheae]